MKIITHWILSALAIMITAYLLPKNAIYVDTIFVALVVAVVLGFLNSIIKPILIVLTLPINILTLGLFTFVINAALVYVTSTYLVSGFFVKSFWWALVFSLVLSIVSAVLERFEPKEEHQENA